MFLPLWLLLCVSLFCCFWLLCATVFVVFIRFDGELALLLVLFLLRVFVCIPYRMVWGGGVDIEKVRDTVGSSFEIN